MDGPGFDRWTRRRFGLAAGGLGVSGFAAFGLAKAVAGKKKRKKRCKRHLESCQQGGKRKCCGDLRCGIPSGTMAAQTVCCKTLGKPCSERSECCADLCCGGPVGELICDIVCI